jgi:hypothetical protein
MQQRCDADICGVAAPGHYAAAFMVVLPVLMVNRAVTALHDMVCTRGISASLVCTQAPVAVALIQCCNH